MPYPYDKAKLDKWCADLQQSVDADGTVWDVYDLAITRT